ncbi:hypothetical protein O7627_36695 [Solwaraspora sp. WMMD1047]|uniref:hypothetical protein n=1 Tax=Solwaraspora sp. WMMD1047 TaxID=3016102 RepID=UPI002415A8B2|nr:hypothetical protein [Solwaraspora sp. WMMD1047]MDG4834809.1 hypothetical protein [Solwaraspora sp. WMMD1047]
MSTNTSTARTVIVCMPADKPIDWFSASEILDWHKLPAGTPRTMFPVRRPRFIGWFSQWSARHLVQVTRRFGAVVWAAGGRKSRLDLTAAVTRANTAAVYRWRTWAQVVRNLPVAKPWGDYLAQHKANPTKVTVEEARRRFEEQPRVLAMLSYNSHPMSTVELDPYELDAYQAGEATYTVVHWQQAITGDAVVTDDGRLLEPASSSLADKLRFLAEAGSYLHKLRRSHQILAVTVGAQP